MGALRQLASPGHGVVFLSYAAVVVAENETDFGEGWQAMKKCPKCRSKDYSAKWDECPKCGRNVTKPVTVTPPVTKPLTGVVAPGSVVGKAIREQVKEAVRREIGRHCSTCTCGPPKTGAERQRAYRERREG